MNLIGVELTNGNKSPCGEVAETSTRVAYTSRSEKQRDANSKLETCAASLVDDLEAHLAGGAGDDLETGLIGA